MHGPEVSPTPARERGGGVVLYHYRFIKNPGSYCNVLPYSVPLGLLKPLGLIVML